MNSEERHRIRNLLQSLIQLPMYLTDDSVDGDFDLDCMIGIAKRNVEQIDEYVEYLDKE